MFSKPAKGHVFTVEEESARRRWAKRFIKRFEGIGQAHGYGIFHGGSLIRDIDIVAFPWRSPMPFPDPNDWVLELHHVLGIHLGASGILRDCSGYTVHQHRTYEFWLPGHEDHPIDLKVVLPARPMEDISRGS